MIEIPPKLKFQPLVPILKSRQFSTLLYRLGVLGLLTWVAISVSGPTRVMTDVWSPLEVTVSNPITIDSSVEVRTAPFSPLEVTVRN